MPGESGNPFGRPPTPEDVKIVRTLNQREFHTIMNRLGWLPADQVERIARDKKTPAFERALAKTLYLAGRSGDPRRLETILSRVVGKVDTRVPAQGEPKPEEGKRPEDMTDQELEAEARAIAERMKGA